MQMAPGLNVAKQKQQKRVEGRTKKHVSSRENTRVFKLSHRKKKKKKKKKNHTHQRLGRFVPRLQRL